MDSNSVVNLWLSYDEIGRAALRIQQEKALAAAERVDQFISECENQIGWTTHSEWRSLTADQQRYDFVSLLRKNPAITELTYLDSTGKEQLKVSRLEVDSVSSAKDFSTE